MNHQEVARGAGAFAAPLMLVVGGSLATVALTAGHGTSPPQAGPAPTVTVTPAPIATASPSPRRTRAVAVPVGERRPAAKPEQPAPAGTPSDRGRASSPTPPASASPTVAAPPSKCGGVLALGLLGNCLFSLGGN